MTHFRPTSRILFFVNLLMASSAWGQVDKSNFTLFNPTPREHMREMSTDRPDKTESPYTVDAGHFQIEADLVTYTQNKTEDAGIETKSKSFGVLVTNVKIGLTNAMDFQAVITPYASEETEVTGSETDKKSGFGDTTLRLKYNLFGNDGGDIAMGLMPFIKVPTHSHRDMGNDQVEGGLILPISLSLPRDWSMGLMSQVNAMKNEADNKYHTEFVSSLTFSHDLSANWGGYVEFYSQSSNEVGAEWVGTADAGVTYGMTPDLQWDFGVNLAATMSADDYNPFVGVSARF